MFEPKLVRSRAALPLNDRQALAALIESKLAPVEVRWTSGHADILASGQVFCSITSEGDLALKLPAERLGELIGNGQAKPRQVGSRTLENWVVLSATDDHARVLGLLGEAKEYVAAAEGTSAQKVAESKKV